MYKFYGLKETTLFSTILYQTNIRFKSPHIFRSKYILMVAPYQKKPVASCSVHELGA